MDARQLSNRVGDAAIVYRLRYLGDSLDRYLKTRVGPPPDATGAAVVSAARAVYAAERAARAVSIFDPSGL